MKKLFLLLLVAVPCWLSAQDALIFESNTLTPMPSQVLRFEAAVAAHNKKYHATGPHGVRVYEIISGKNAGRYQWVMGPGHWSDLDTRPADGDNHSVDWVSNVLPNLTVDQNTLYIRLDTKRSNFGHDFDVNKIFFYYWGLNQNPDWEKIDTLLGKVKRVYKEKMPDDIFGVYRNELGSTSEGKDIIMGFFFDKYAWMGIDNGFDKKFDMVYGKDAFKTFIKDWNSQIRSFESEIWEFRADLSGLPARVTVADRQ
ncbi:MAG TPA: hypothetical protein VFV79_00290 [Saprospiraceae bacterium]|nr:hypothetical protein [Saprospiraceae bacterium]